jgi:hypothetical protein
MLFNIEADVRNQIIGYIVPDGFSTTPRLRVVSEGEMIYEADADVIKEALVVAGRHETGMCGFLLDESRIAGLGELEDLQIYEAATGVLIYGRRKAFHTDQIIVRLETSLLPLWRIDKKYSENFQYFFCGMESLGRETVNQQFLLNGVDSMYLSGRIFLRNYLNYIDDQHELVAFIHDPYVEMAERLVFLSQLGTKMPRILGERDAMIYAPVAEFASELNLSSHKKIKSQLKSMSMEVAARLSNPLTRLLTTSSPDDAIGRNSLASALDALSTFKFAGLRRDGQAASDLFGAILNLPAPSFPSLLSDTQRLAEFLRETAVADILIEKDLELYHYLSKASEHAAERLDLQRQQVSK